MALSVEFIYLAARLAGQWIKEQGIIVCMLIVGFLYLVARLTRQWIKERGIIDMRVTLHQTSLLVWCMVKSGPVFCSLAIWTFPDHKSVSSPLLHIG